MCPGCWEVKEARAFIEPLKLKPSCFRKCWSVMGHITRAWCTFNDISGHGDNTLHSDEILWSCWVEDCPHASPSVSLTLLLPHRCFHVSKPLNRNLCIFFFFFFLLCLGVLYHPGTSLLGCLVCLTPRGFFLSALCSGTTCISLCCSKAAVLQALPRPSLLLGNLGGCCCNVSSLSACVWVLQWARISKVKVKLSVYANLKL